MLRRPRSIAARTICGPRLEKEKIAATTQIPGREELGTVHLQLGNTVSKYEIKVDAFPIISFVMNRSNHTGGTPMNCGTPDGFYGAAFINVSVLF